MPSRGHRAILVCAALTVCAVLVPASCFAQRSDGQTKIPKPQDIELQTKDDVVLKATFYPGTEGQDSVPIIMLHGYKGQRGEFRDLARMLQEDMGHAVLIPDLRGHGESTTVIGSARDLDATRMPREQFERMIQFDMEKLKQYLMSLNNKGELNIEKLCVIGAEMGAVIAARWAAQDWNWPRLATGKQGQDVKALILISPIPQIKGLKIDPALDHWAVRSELSISLIVGEDDRRAFSYTKRIHNRLRRYHRDPPEDEVADKKDLFMDAFPTSLQGTKLLGETLTVDGSEVSVNQLITTFIDWRLVNQTYPWKERRRAVP